MDNVGCYHDMISYLAKLDNTSEYKEMYREAADKLRLGYKHHNITWHLNGKKYTDLHKQQAKGGVWVLRSKTNEFPFDTKWDKVTVQLLKTVDDFTVQVEQAGSYKDSLGGGWSQTVHKWKVRDRYFAAMECTC